LHAELQMELEARGAPTRAGRRGARL
jgi:hypothetical protein